jgi:hypothetical protein
MQISTSLLDYVDLPPEVQLVKYSALHYAHLDLDDDYMVEVAKVASPDIILENQTSSGIAYTAMLYGKPAAVFGSLALFYGVEEMWLMLGANGRKHAKTLTRVAHGFVDFRMKAGGLHRLQMTVRCRDLKAVRWAKSLGFEIEGLMRKYGTDGSDFFMMSKV